MHVGFIIIERRQSVATSHQIAGACPLPSPQRAFSSRLRSLSPPPPLPPKRRLPDSVQPVNAGSRAPCGILQVATISRVWINKPMHNPLPEFAVTPLTNNLHKQLSKNLINQKFMSFALAFIYRNRCSKNSFNIKLHSFA